MPMKIYYYVLINKSFTKQTKCTEHEDLKQRPRKYYFLNMSNNLYA